MSMKKLVTTILFAAAFAMATFSQTVTNVLYSTDFSDATTTNSYLSNQTLTLSEKSWFVSNYRYYSSEFRLGCSTFSTDSYDLSATELADVNTAWQAADESYESVTQVFGMLFANEIENASSISLEWSSASGAMVVFLFVDTDGSFSLAATEYASASTAGSISCKFDDGTTVNRVAIVVRGGASLTSTATKRNIVLSSFKITNTEDNVSSAPTPEFSLDGETPVWQGTGVTISADENYSDLTLYYSIDGATATSVSANSVTIPIDASCQISAYTTFGEYTSETATCSFTVFDLNEDFTDWSGDYPDNWSGSIAKSNVSLLSDEGGVALTQTATENKRLYTYEFIVDAGTYTFSADCQFLTTGSQTCTLENTKGSGSSHYYDSSDSQATATTTDIQSLSLAIELEEQSVIKLSITLSAKSASEDDNWTVNIDNVSFSDDNAANANAISTITDNAESAISVQGSKVVITADEGTKITVYDLLGRVVYSSVTEEVTTTIDALPTRQILVVRVGNEAAKIVLQ